jgi:WD40 repeat protein
VKLWDVGTGQEGLTFKGHLGAVNRAYFSPDGKTVASDSDDSMVKLWDVQTGKERATLKPSVVYLHLWPLSFSPDGKTIVSAGHGVDVKKIGKIRLWDAGSKRERAVLTGHPGQVYALAISPDGKTLASGSEDKTIKLWDLAPSK